MLARLAAELLVVGRQWLAVGVQIYWFTGDRRFTPDEALHVWGFDDRTLARLDPAVQRYHQRTGFRISDQYDLDLPAGTLEPLASVLREVVVEESDLKVRADLQKLLSIVTDAQKRNVGLMFRYC